MRKLLTILLLFCLPIMAAPKTAQVRQTYYSTKGKTALGIRTRKGICAVSPDLERMGFKLGEYVLLIYKDGRKIKYLIADRTNKRLRNTVDVWSEKPIPNDYCIAKLIYDND